MLRVSYCDSAVLVVLHASSVMRLPSLVINSLPYVCSRGYIFSPIVMKLGQNVCLNEISGGFENGSCQVKNYVTRSNPRKTFCTL